MLNKVFLLLGLALGIAGQTPEFVPGEYVFVFNLVTPVDARTQDAALTTVRGLVGTNGVVQPFSLGNATGFFLFNVSDSIFKIVNDSIGKYGSSQQNSIYRVPTPTQDANTAPVDSPIKLYYRNQTASPFKKPCCGNKRCCGRPVSYWYNYNLDQLDSTTHVRDGTFCAPAEECDKVDVFVFDSGIWNPAPINQHPEFEGRVKEWYDVGFGFGDSMGVGTHAAGIIGGRSYGVTQNVNLHSVKVIQLSTNVIAMVNGFIATHVWMLSNPNAHAVVLLPGIICPQNWLLDWIVNYMATLSPYKTRILLITSAGDVANWNACKCNFAANPAVLAVGAVNSAMGVYNVANLGPCIDVLASGVTVLSTWMFDGTAWLTGSRQAAALAAGVISQYWVENPTLTSTAIFNLITTTATSSIHVTTTVTGLPTTIPNKVIKYQCPGKCCAFECS